MKRIYLLVAALAYAGAALAAGKHDHAPKHGGIVVEVKDVDYEIVAKPEVIQIHLRDHGKNLKLEGYKAKVTLLNGTQKSEVMLQPVGGTLEAKGAFKVTNGTKGIALVTTDKNAATTMRFQVK